MPTAIRDAVHRQFGSSVRHHRPRVPQFHVDEELLGVLLQGARETRRAQATGRGRVDPAAREVPRRAKE